MRQGIKTNHDLFETHSQEILNTLPQCHLFRFHLLFHAGAQHVGWIHTILFDDDCRDLQSSLLLFFECRLTLRFLLFRFSVGCVQLLLEQGELRGQTLCGIAPRLELDLTAATKRAALRLRR